MDFDEQKPINDEPLPQEKGNVPAGWLSDALSGEIYFPAEVRDEAPEISKVPAGWLWDALNGGESLPVEEIVIVQDDGEVPAQALPESVTVQKKASEPRWRQIVRALYGGTSEEALRERLSDIDRAISDDPDSAVNYVLRGEALLEAREYAPAHEAFEQGLALAEAQVAQNDWGIVAQAVQDRAVQGLAKTLKRLTN